MSVFKKILRISLLCLVVLLGFTAVFPEWLDFKDILLHEWEQGRADKKTHKSNAVEKNVKPAKPSQQIMPPDTVKNKGSNGEETALKKQSKPLEVSVEDEKKRQQRKQRFDLLRQTMEEEQKLTINKPVEKTLSIVLKNPKSIEAFAISYWRALFGGDTALLEKLSFNALAIPNKEKPDAFRIFDIGHGRKIGQDVIVPIIIELTKKGETKWIKLQTVIVENDDYFLVDYEASNGATQFYQKSIYEYRTMVANYTEEHQPYKPVMLKPLFQRTGDFQFFNYKKSNKIIPAPNYTYVEETLARKISLLFWQAIANQDWSAAKKLSIEDQMTLDQYREFLQGPLTPIKTLSFRPEANYGVRVVVLVEIEVEGVLIRKAMQTAVVMYEGKPKVDLQVTRRNNWNFSSRWMSVVDVQIEEDSPIFRKNWVVNNDKKELKNDLIKLATQMNIWLENSQYEALYIATTKAFQGKVSYDLFVRKLTNFNYAVGRKRTLLEKEKYGRRDDKTKPSVSSYRVDKGFEVELVRYGINASATITFHLVSLHNKWLIESLSLNGQSYNYNNAVPWDYQKNNIRMPQ